MNHLFCLIDVDQTNFIKIILHRNIFFFFLALYQVIRELYLQPFKILTSVFSNVLLLHPIFVMDSCLWAQFSSKTLILNVTRFCKWLLPVKYYLIKLILSTINHFYLNVLCYLHCNALVLNNRDLIFAILGFLSFFYMELLHVFRLLNAQTVQSTPLVRIEPGSLAHGGSNSTASPLFNK